MSESNGRCEFEHLDYCCPPKEYTGFKCSKALPIQPGDICEKCGATDEDLMTEEEYDAMQKLSEGVQKIFEDAVKNPPTRSFPVEPPERERERKRTYSTYVCIYASVFLLFLKITFPIAIQGCW